MADYKVHHIAHLQHGYGRNRYWEEEEFPTKWEAEKRVEEYRKRTLNAGYVTSTMETTNISADDILSSKVVSRYANRAFSSSKIF